MLSSRRAVTRGGVISPVVVSSDCSRSARGTVHIYGWFEIIVNCLEPHPSIPVMAVSGLDNNIKIVSPGHKVITCIV
uniref:Uncharacterized protein n=1 Tax=Megaselia scalaris TaxID=36166 RepID=T1GLT7_MEGSC